jgi:hypothetical protein
MENLVKKIINIYIPFLLLHDTDKILEEATGNKKKKGNNILEFHNEFKFYCLHNDNQQPHCPRPRRSYKSIET